MTILHPPPLPALRRLRRARSLTQQALADRAGVSRVSIARIESGRNSPGARSLRRLARALDVGVAELLRGGDYP